MAPEVRNEGLIVAHKGTVALAAGELVEHALADGEVLLAALRSEFKLLARTIAALAEGNGEATP